MKSSCRLQTSHGYLSPRTQNSGLCHTRSLSLLVQFDLFTWFRHYYLSQEFCSLIAEGLTSTNSKHISRDPLPTVAVWRHHTSASCQTHGKHSLLHCCVHVSCLQCCCLGTRWSNTPQYVLCSLELVSMVTMVILALSWLYDLDTQLFMRHVAFEKPIVCSVQSSDSIMTGRFCVFKA
jgi:hypothetical protein